MEDSKRLEKTLEVLAGGEKGYARHGNKDWSKRLFYETIIRPENISKSSRPSFEYYIPSKEGISPSELIEDPKRYLYKGGTRQSIRSIRSGKGPYGDGVFASGYPEVGATYAEPYFSRNNQKFKKASFRDLKNYLNPNPMVVEAAKNNFNIQNKIKNNYSKMLSYKTHFPK